MVEVTRPEELNSLKMLIYGESGVGKTRFVAQSQDVPELQKVLFVGIDIGSLSIRHRRDLAYVTVSDDREFAEALKILQTKKNGYRTIVIDSFTQLQKALMRPLMKRVVLQNPKMEDVEVPSMREWGIISERLQVLLMRLSHQGYNVLLTATERTDRDETIGLPYARPDLPGRLPNHVTEWADIVGRMSAQLGKGRGPSEIERVIHFQPSGRWTAKDRSGMLGISFKVGNEDNGVISFVDMYRTIFADSQEGQEGQEGQETQEG
jgi:phage nucleotide-binding protein